MVGTVGRRKQGQNTICFHPDRRPGERARPDNRYHSQFTLTELCGNVEAASSAGTRDTWSSIRI